MQKIQILKNNCRSKISPDALWEGGESKQVSMAPMGKKKKNSRAGIQGPDGQRKKKSQQVSRVPMDQERISGNIKKSRYPLFP